MNLNKSPKLTNTKQNDFKELIEEYLFLRFNLALNLCGFGQMGWVIWPYYSHSWGLVQFGGKAFYKSAPDSDSPTAPTLTCPLLQNVLHTPTIFINMS